ncbi:unnamed protein product [Closterium sp. NIES-54]
MPTKPSVDSVFVIRASGLKPLPELPNRLALREARSPGLWAHSDPLLNKPFYPSGLVVGTLTWYQSEGLGFESQCVHFGHPSAGGCQRSTGDPRLILGKGYRFVVLGGYGRTDPLLNKPFYPNGLARSPGGLWAHFDPLLNKPFYPSGLVVGILTCVCVRAHARACV